MQITGKFRETNVYANQAISRTIRQHVEPATLVAKNAVIHQAQRVLSVQQVLTDNFQADHVCATTVFTRQM